MADKKCSYHKCEFAHDNDRIYFSFRKHDAYEWAKASVNKKLERLSVKTLTESITTVYRTSIVTTGL